MVGPLLQIISSVLTYYDTDREDVYWLYTARWGLFSSLSILLWFHEFYLGGPEFKDKIYSNFNLVSVFGYVVQLVFTGVADFKDDSNPTASVANILLMLISTVLAYNE